MTEAAGSRRRDVEVAMQEYVGERLLRQNRVEARVRQEVTEDGEAVWGSGQVGGSSR